MKNPEKQVTQLFGQHIQELRQRQGLDLQTLSKKAGYDRNELSALERGEVNIEFDTALRIAEVLDADFPSLFLLEYPHEKNLHYLRADYLLRARTFIKNELKKKKITQARVFIETGVQEAATSRLLTGKNENPTLNTILRVASVLDIEDYSVLWNPTEGGVR